MLCSFIEELDASPVFIHASMRSIGQVFGVDDGMDRFLDCFRGKFPTIMAPGFTPSFRKSGVFHVQFSRPEYGAFSELFLEHADGRTLDPIHSILHIGDNPFGDGVTHDTFSPDGHFSTVNAIDSWIFNFGTPWFVSTQLHLIERLGGVRYINSKKFPGIVYVNEHEYFPVDHTNHGHTKGVTWNRFRIDKAIAQLPSYRCVYLGSIPVQAVKSVQMTDALVARLSNDPYFLVR